MRIDDNARASLKNSENRVNPKLADSLHLDEFSDDKVLMRFAGRTHSFDRVKRIRCKERRGFSPLDPTDCMQRVHLYRHTNAPPRPVRKGRALYRGRFPRD